MPLEASKATVALSMSNDEMSGRVGSPSWPRSSSGSPSMESSNAPSSPSTSSTSYFATTFARLGSADSASSSIAVGSIWCVSRSSGAAASRNSARSACAAGVAENQKGADCG
eukprot:scaffold4987_cov91-Isochrysis_galbana.AAC.4